MRLRPVLALVVTLAALHLHNYAAAGAASPSGRLMLDLSTVPWRAQLAGGAGARTPGPLVS